jgi:hypothetical protein
VPAIAASLADAATTGGTFPPGDWALVANVPALQQASYIVAVPTISNLAPNDFLVTTSTATPSIWFVSGVMSGQSVDNLAPAQPAAFAGSYSAGTAHLTWNENGEHDLGGYRLYRGSSADFTPSAENLVATLVANQYDDPSATAGDHYKLSAFDVNGNASAFASIQVGAGVGVEEGMPLALALEGVRPNPATGERLEVRFSLPGTGPARLSLVDLAGRLIADHDVAGKGPGRHSVDLAAGRRLVPGLYWLRLTQGRERRVARVSVLGQ